MKHFGWLIRAYLIGSFRVYASCYYFKKDAAKYSKCLRPCKITEFKFNHFSDSLLL